MQVVFGNKSETKRKLIDIISENGDDMTDIRYISTKEAAGIMGLSTRRVVGSMHPFHDALVSFAERRDITMMKILNRRKRN